MSTVYSLGTPSGWRRIHGKPYITVSSKGLSNGLSSRPNDGAVFGPDTMLGATSPNQYGPPYTQTAGIKEAINYIASRGSGKILLKSGIYNITAPFAEFQTSGFYGQIVLPYVVSSATTTDNPVIINIEGEADIFGDANGNPNGIPVPTGGSVLFFQPPSVPSGSQGQYAGIQGGPNSWSSFVFLTMKNITMRQNPNPSFTNVSVGAVAGVHFENIRNDINFAINSNVGGSSTPNPAPPQPTNTSGIGIWDDAGGAQNRSFRYYSFIRTIGYYLGFHFNASFNSIYQGIHSDFCQYGAEIGKGGGHGITIYGFASELTNTSLLLNSALLTLIDYKVAGTSGSEWYIPTYDFATEANTSNYVYVRNQALLNGLEPKINLASGSSLYWKAESSYTNYPTVTDGTTSGTVSSIVLENSSYYKKWIFYFNGYENDTTTDQEIGYAQFGPTTTAVVTFNSTGLTISATTTGVTITAPDSTTTYSGIVIVEGY